MIEKKRKREKNVKKEKDREMRRGEKSRMKKKYDGEEKDVAKS